MKKLLFIFALLMAGSYMTLQAQTSIKEINVVSEEYPGAVNKDKTGIYCDIIKMVYEPEGIKINIIVEPYLRTVEDVKTQKADFWVASFLNEQDFPLYPKWHMDTAPVLIAFPKEKANAWKGPDSLPGKRVVWQRGYGFEHYLKQNMTVTEIDEPKSAFQMLLRDRADYYIDVQQGIDAFFENDREIEKGKFQFEKILDLKMYMAFANNTRGKALKELWDKRMEILLKSKELKTLYDKYKYPWPF